MNVTIERKTPTSGITVRVTNNNTEPVTFMNRNGPFHDLALSHGLFNIIPEGGTQPLDIGLARYHVKYVSDPSPDLYERTRPKTWNERFSGWVRPLMHEDYTTIRPGESAVREIPFEYRYTYFSNASEGEAWKQNVGKKVKVQMKGIWRPLWMTTKDYVLHKEGGREWYGGYISNVITTTLT